MGHSGSPSRNEHAKLRWYQVDESKRYLDKYGKDKDDDFKRKVVGDGFIPRYRELQEGMRDGLTKPGWKKNALFAGYKNFGPAHFCRGISLLDQHIGLVNQRQYLVGLPFEHTVLARSARLIAGVPHHVRQPAAVRAPWPVTQTGCRFLHAPGSAR